MASFNVPNVNKNKTTNLPFYKMARNFNLGMDFLSSDPECQSGFIRMEKEEISDFILGQKAKATQYKEKSDMNIFSRLM